MRGKLRFNALETKTCALSKDMHIRLIGDSKVAPSLNVVFLSLCVHPLIDCRPVQGVLSSWYTPPSKPQSRVGQREKMN